MKVFNVLVYGKGIMTVLGGQLKVKRQKSPARAFSFIANIVWLQATGVGVLCCIY